MGWKARSLPLFLCCLFFTAELSAQPEAWNWYFGRLAGLTFASGEPIAIADGLLSTNEGCATQSDPTTGALLFYTDGVTVWNRLHEVMPNGTGLNGDKSTSQSALIVQQPGNPFVFYVFNAAPHTSASIGGRCLCLYYSIIDIRRNGGYGDVVRKNEPLAFNITEHLTASLNCDGTGVWIVARSMDNRTFQSFQLTRDQLIATPVVSAAGDPALSVRDVGHMHISPDSRSLVMTSTQSNTQLFEFDAATGIVSGGMSLFATSGRGEHYGAAFSPSSRYVYVAVANEEPTAPTRVYQFDTKAGSPGEIAASRVRVGELQGVTSWAPMQLAPDKRIYIGRPQFSTLSVIGQPEQRGSACEFRDGAIPLTGQCQSGLPQFMGSIFLPESQRRVVCNLPKASFTGPASICQTSCVRFTNTSSGPIDSYEWSFGGGVPAASSASDPGQICFPVADTFVIQLIVRNAYGVDTARATLIVDPKPDVTIDPVPLQCEGALVQLRARGAETYEWSPTTDLDDSTSSSPIATPFLTTAYTVIGRTAAGCSDTATVVVEVSRMRASADTVICVGDAVRMRTWGAAEALWFPADGLSDPQSLNPVANPARTTAYTVMLRNGSCETIDTVIVEVVDSVVITITGPDTLCDGTSAPLHVTGGTSYIWWPAETLSDPSSPDPVATPLVTTTYHVRAFVGNCSAVDSITIVVSPSPTLNASNDTTICTGGVALLRARGADRYTWEPSIGLDDPSSATPVARPLQTTRYTVVGSTLAGCSDTATVLVTVLAVEAVSAGPDKAICRGGTVQLSGTGVAESIAWFPTTGLSDPTTLSPIAAPDRTTTYVLTARSGDCLLTDTMTVVVSTVEVRTSPNVTICYGDRTMLRAEGAARFEWTPSLGLSDPTIATPEANPERTTTYTVRGYDAFGCVAEQNVTVFVVDRNPVKIRVPSINGPAGQSGVGLPIFIAIDPQLLPAMIERLFVELRFDASIYLPRSAERGQMVQGTRDGQRIVYLVVENVPVVTAEQKLTEIFGTILLGDAVTAPITWAEASLTGIACPGITTQDGSITADGCFIDGRMWRLFSDASLVVRPRLADESIEIEIGGSETGGHDIALVAADGRTLWSYAVTRSYGDAPTNAMIDTRTIPNGMYFVRLSSPTGVRSKPLPLLR